MKKKPALQNVIDNIENYTVEDIDKLSGGVFPKWIKNELKNMVEDHDAYVARGNKTSYEAAQEIANIMLEKSKQKSSQ